jgi:hypothetical protein
LSSIVRLKQLSTYCHGAHLKIQQSEQERLKLLRKLESANEKRRREGKQTTGNRKVAPTPNKTK